MMNEIVNLTLAQIVTKYPSAAVLFEKHGLDYCCHGKQKIEEACHHDEKKSGLIIHLLHRLIEENNLQPQFHPEHLNPDELINHIVEKHHGYLKNSIPVIEAHLAKIVSKHGER